MIVYKVVTQGIKQGADAKAVASRLSALLKIDAQKALALLKPKSVVLKRTQDAATAKKYQAVLQKAGLLCRVEKEASAEAVTLHATAKGVAEVAANSAKMPVKPLVEQMTCPKCATVQAKADECVQCGIVIAKYEALFESEADTGLEMEVVEEESSNLRLKLLVLLLVAGLAWFVWRQDAPEEIPPVVDEPKASSEMLVKEIQTDLDALNQQDEAQLKRFERGEISDTEAQAYQLEQLNRLQSRLNELSTQLGDDARLQADFVKRVEQLKQLREQVEKNPLPFYLFRSQHQLLFLQVATLAQQIQLNN